MKAYWALIPPEATKLMLTLFLSFLLGLEREEHQQAKDGHASFGGVRTFPLIGLLGYAMALIAGRQILPLAVGFAVLGAFLLVSYRHKIETSQKPGITTEVTGLSTFLVGALISHEQYWIAVSIVVISLFLLELKSGLEGMARKLPPEEIITFTKFLLLAAVILPIVPDEEWTSFHLNPYKTWLIVVAVSAISYVSYILQIVARGKGGGVLLAALLGGAYSSTATTIVMARQARKGDSAYRYSGAILLACGVMYLRMGIFIAIFNGLLAMEVAWRLGVVAITGITGGWLWARRHASEGEEKDGAAASQNPLELKVALLFALLFVLLLIATKLVAEQMGTGGLYALAVLVGVTDITPFILGVTQAAGHSTSIEVAAVSVMIAMASNNVVNGFYALYLADRRTGKMALSLLAGLGALAVIVSLI